MCASKTAAPSRRRWHLIERGLDFADALHHASYRDCDAMASFDDKRFARRAAKLGLAPRVVIPA